MRLKKKKEEVNIPEDDALVSIPETEETKPLVPEKKPETKPADLDLRKKAEKVLEDILLGNLKPSKGMKISLSFKGPFNLLGTETTADSTFTYNYPDGSNEETPKQEEAIPEKPKTPETPKEPETKRIF